MVQKVEPVAIPLARLTAVGDDHVMLRVELTETVSILWRISEESTQEEPGPIPWRDLAARMFEFASVASSSWGLIPECVEGSAAAYLVGDMVAVEETETDGEATILSGISVLVPVTRYRELMLASAAAVRHGAGWRGD